jgi:carboxymethylenebutenolidase
MGEMIRLTAADGFELGAYRADPSGTPKGAVVVLQEIFGVNGHIRRVADGYAAAGYVAIAPKLFDRISPDLELGYTADDMQRGIALKAESKTEAALQDIAAARAAVAAAGKQGVVGFCWGGYLSWLSATRLPGFAASVVYYGGGIGSVAAETPRCPVLLHFGERDKHIPPADIDAVREANPDRTEIHVYPADHGFNCDERGAFDAESARIARERTLAFFAAHLAG